MNKKIVFSLLFVLCFLLIGCENNSNETYLVDITYKEFNKKLDNKDSFVLEIVQTGCGNCAEFTPKFKNVLEKNKVVGYSLNITDMDQKDLSQFLKDYNVDGTPTVIFFKDGKETSAMDRLSGASVTKDVIESKLKKTGFIK